MERATCDKFLIDGFPRNKDNLDGWNKRVAEKVKLLFVLFFDCSDDVRKLKLLKKFNMKCNETYYCFRCV